MSASSKEDKRRGEMQLAGQNSEDARAAVKLQREVKKKKDALRKIEKKLKSLTAGSDEHSEIMIEIEKCKEEINKLERSIDLHNFSNINGQNDSNTENVSIADSLSATHKEILQNKSRESVKQNDDVAIKELHELLSLTKDKKEAVTKLERTTPEISLTNTTAENTTIAIEKADSVKKESYEEEEDERNARELLADVVARERSTCTNKQILCTNATYSIVHPRVAEVGLMMGKMCIVGGSARTLAMLHAFRELLSDTSVLADKTMQEVDCNAFEHIIDINYNFLRFQREPTSGMRYVRKTLVLSFAFLHNKAGLQRLDSKENKNNSISLSPFQENEEVVKCISNDEINKKEENNENLHDLSARLVALKILRNLESEMLMSIRSIVEDRSLPYVTNNDVILTFGRSNLVESILISRARNAQRKPKRVIVLDAAPLFEGKALAFRLAEVGLEVTYALITTCCTLMPRCTKVFIGASSVLQNGDVFGRCGTAIVATCAKALRKPVLCFCESYKFVPAVWLGNLAQNTKLINVNGTLPGTLQRDGVSCLLMNCYHRELYESQQQYNEFNESSKQEYYHLLQQQLRHQQEQQCRALCSPFQHNTPSLLSPIPTSHPSWNEWKKGDFAVPAVTPHTHTSPLTHQSPTTLTTFPHSPYITNLVNRTHITEDAPQSTISPQNVTSSFNASDARTSPILGTMENTSALCSSGYLYDLTPASAVDMVICEMGCLHTSAIIAAIGDRESRDAIPILHMRENSPTHTYLQA